MPALVSAGHTAGLVIKCLFFALLALLVLRVLVAVIRFAVAPAAAKRNYPRMILARLRWRWLTRNLNLAYVDPHQKTKIRAAFGPSIGKNVRIEKVKRTKVRYPPARFRADPYGLVVKVKTIPKVGRAELEDNAEHLGNAWRCVRVQVSQPKPGRLIVRGLRRDPLTIPFGIEAAPADAYTRPVVTRPYLGRDEWATDRYLELPGLPGITVGGLPGYGKTSLILSWLFILAAFGCVQFVFIDGKGGGDYREWIPRAWLYCDDDRAEAADILSQVYELMRNRLANVVELTGFRNAWKLGPTPEFPLIVTIVDECHTFFDLDGVKGEKEAERNVRQCRYYSHQIVTKSRAVLFLTIFITQKQTGDAIPTAIRDNCPLGLSFATKTVDAAVAALGDDIRKYESVCPTSLLDRPDYIGVCSTTLRTGKDPFTRLRVPEISEAAADQRARETAHLRCDPTTLLVPAAGEPVPV